MAGWTAQDTSLWIRGAVQQVQIEVEAILRSAGRGETTGGGFVPITLPKDGKYSLVLHNAFKEALAMVGPSASVPVSAEDIGAIDLQGPRGLAAAIVDNEQARAFATAWAWWTYHRNPNKDATQAWSVITDYNVMLTGDGDQTLAPADVLSFVGDEGGLGGGGGSKYGSTVKWVVGLGLVATAGWILWKVLPKRAPMKLRDALRSRPQEDEG
jgi:hypothetical protein